jgi:predicted dinucleotide-binding enzyme
MKIGIIGAGNIGGALTRRLSELGHDVSVANSRGPETLADLVAESGARAVRAEDAPKGAEVIVVTIPLKNVAQLPDDLLASAPEGAVVIDTNNYYPQQRDGRIAEIEDGMVESRWTERRLGRPVVKAFNNIYAQHLLEKGRPAGVEGRIALPDPAAKAVVLGLVEELGFDAVDAGGLEDSWRQQPGTPVYASDHDAEGVRESLARANPERPAEFRASEG